MVCRNTRGRQLSRLVVPASTPHKRALRTQTNADAFAAFLLLCLVPGKLLCFADHKILTLAERSAAEHEWIIDEDS